MAPGSERRTPHPPKDFPPRKVLLSGATLAGTLVVLGALLLLFQRAILPPLGERDTRPAPGTSPMLETEFETGELRRRLDEQAEERLGSYGWVDREKGLVHIPIRRAMEIRARQSGNGAKR